MQRFWTTSLFRSTPIPRMRLFTLMVLFVFLLASKASAQNRSEQVLSMANGIQFEGLLAEIPQYNESAFGLNPYVGGNQIVVIDDGLRQVFISHYNIGKVADSLRNEIKFDIPQRPFSGDQGFGILQFAGPFNEFGHREFAVVERSGSRRKNKTYVQGITQITPRYCKVQTLMGGTPPNRRWDMSLSTTTIPKHILRSLLLNRIGSEDITVNDYFDIADFFRQARDFEQARNEYIEIGRNFPDQKERIRENRIELDQLIGRQVLGEIETRIKAGQTRLGSAFAEAKNKQDLAPDILARFQKIQEDEAARQSNLKHTRQKVIDLVKKIRDLNNDQMDVVNRFLGELETELSYDNLSRLDAYLLTAEDAGTPDKQNLAKAISGWLLGSNNATANLAVVESMFPARDLALEYLQTETSDLRRQQILAELKELEAGSPKYLDALLKNAKPVEAADLDNYDASEPIEFFVEMPGTVKKPDPWRFRCIAHLPPEYNPYRKYPMIITLADGGRTPLENFLNVWVGSHNKNLSSKLNLAVRNGSAMRHGYIVVAVDWRAGFQVNYNYSPREHRTVTDALYQALRKFSVDQDRVFLAGHGTGADAAYDIGMAHPEHFAGVVGYSGQMGKYTDHYITNKHVNLPMYCVLGEKDFAGRKSFKLIANRWLKSKFLNELTLIHYKGRPKEYFPEDLPAAFDWMKGQSRRWPGGPGFEFECRVLRDCDSYFWFFELDGIPAQNNVEPVMFTRTKKYTEITIAGKISAQNTFRLRPTNTTNIKNKSTLWLSPEYFDFSKRLVVLGRSPQKLDVTPSSKTLLDDVLRRGDTLHPYWAGVELVSGDWVPVDAE
ncbi:MAG: hypothetical protein AAFN77_21835 [Planctomycetota bacterium]